MPSDYISVTKEARRNPTPYEAIPETYNFIKDYGDKSTLRYSSIRPQRKTGDAIVVNLRAIQYTSDGTIKFKLNFDDGWSDIPIGPKKANNLVIYSLLLTTPISIASAKFNHLQQLKEVLSKDCHLFYDKLPHE